MDKPKTKEYIGDGVYADFDGYHVVLTTEDGISVSNTIFLDDRVVEALIGYCYRRYGKIKKD